MTKPLTTEELSLSSKLDYDIALFSRERVKIRARDIHPSSLASEISAFLTLNKLDPVCLRIIYVSPTIRVIDFGSYSEFLCIFCGQFPKDVHNLI